MTKDKKVLNRVTHQKFPNSDFVENGGLSREPLYWKITTGSGCEMKEVKTREDFMKRLYDQNTTEEDLEETVRQTKNYHAFLHYLVSQENSPFGPATIGEALVSASAVIRDTPRKEFRKEYGPFAYAIVKLMTEKDKVAEYIFGGKDKLVDFLKRRESELGHLKHFLSEENQPNSLRPNYLKYSRFAMLELDDIPPSGIRGMEISDRFRMLELD